MSQAELKRALTPALASAVGSAGLLQLRTPDGTGRPLLASRDAEAFAVALARNNLPYDSNRLDQERGGPIAYQTLTVCGRTVYAAAAFERPAADDPASAAIPMQKALGPWWLTTLCAPGGDRQLNVAVSAYATDLRLDTTGQIDFPAIGGNDFVAQGIPQARQSDELPSPEAAAILAFKLSGRRVSAVPELVAPYFRDNVPQGARWRVRLDSPATVLRGDGTSVRVSDLYVSRASRTGPSGAQTWAASPDQPVAVEVQLVPQARVGENIDAYFRRKEADTRTVTVSRRADVPIAFTPGTPTP